MRSASQEAWVKVQGFKAIMIVLLFMDVTNVTCTQELLHINPEYPRLYYSFSPLLKQMKIVGNTLRENKCVYYII